MKTNYKTIYWSTSIKHMSKHINEINKKAKFQAGLETEKIFNVNFGYCFLIFMILISILNT